MFDQHQASRLVETYSDMILRVSYGYLARRDDAQDICHDVLLKILTLSPHFDSPEHERAYIIRATINTCKKFLTQAERRLVDSYEDVPEVAFYNDDSGEDYELPDSETDLGVALSRLSPVHREVLMLRYWAGFSVTDIAEQLAITPGAVSMRLNRARTYVREFLTGDNHE